MFLVSQESQNTNRITLVTPKLPPKDSDPIPAEPTREVAKGDAGLAQRIRANFQRYVPGLKAHGAQRGGTLSMSNVGRYLNEQPGYLKAYANTPGLGKKGEGGQRKILEVLGFKFDKVQGKMDRIRNPP